MIGAAGSEFDLGTHRYEEFAFGLDIANVGDVLEDDFLLGQNRRGHAGESRVLGAGGANGADERIAAANYEFIHDLPTQISPASFPPSVIAPARGLSVRIGRRTTSDTVGRALRLAVYACGASNVGWGNGPIGYD